MVKQSWCFPGTNKKKKYLKVLSTYWKTTYYLKESAWTGYEWISFLFHRSFFKHFFFLFSSLFFVCVFERPYKNRSTQSERGLVAAHQKVQSMPIRDLVQFRTFSVCDHCVFLFGVCFLFHQPLSSAHFHVLPLTTVFQPSSWSKGETKYRLGFFFFSQKEKKKQKIDLASPVFSPLGYIRSKQHRLFWELAAEAAVQTWPTLSFSFECSVLGRGPHLPLVQDLLSEV